jgi:succinyl-CoA:acetate CoA-transferase
MIMLGDRIGHAALRAKQTSAEHAASLIAPGSTVGMSGFTGSGYPKAVPLALAQRIQAAHQAGDPFRVRVWTGASTGPELDGALAGADGIEFRLPYNSDPVAREKINRGEMAYADMHLSQVAPMAWQGCLGSLDTAVVEVSGIRPDGSLIPSSSVGNNKTWLDRARQVILEVNRWQSTALEGMHDIYYGTALHPIGCRSRSSAPTIASASRPSAAIPTRSSPSSRRRRPTAIWPLRFRTRRPAGSRGT